MRVNCESQGAPELPPVKPPATTRSGLAAVEVGVERRVKQKATVRVDLKRAMAD